MVPNPESCRITMIRIALVTDTVSMAIGTLWSNRMRSALTVLGVVIGITAIVGMTSIIRGFDESVRNLFRQIGPKTIVVQRFGLASFGSGADFKEILKRPNLTLADARAVARECPSVATVDIRTVGAQERVFFRKAHTKPLSVIGVSEKYTAISSTALEAGRFFAETEVLHRRPVVVLAQTAAKALFPDTDPIGKAVRVGLVHYSVVGVLAPLPSVGGFGTGQDDVLFIPYSAYEKQFGLSANSFDRGDFRMVMIAALPRETASRAQAMREIEEVMRIRHGLKLNQADDFDLLTQDEALRIFDRFTQATYIGLVVISSIALMVGGIGVMAIMMISVTERTREIGIRKALGARRFEILWQFLLEATVLTSVGGVLGIVLGAGIGTGVSYLTRFPVSLPLWSFALGFGFSASVGIFFGLVPAVRASRLDPIEALRYE
jgi:putative ABC transport system permease protein